ncbi:hypothetical protein HYU19_04105 [Candidatus Woesearchaeota archaeon]|nr:hypothetical protein [Candidatus Woesearchaeota archaeon]
MIRNAAQQFILRLLDDKQFAKKAYRWAMLGLFAIAGIIFLKYLFLLFLVAAAFLYKAICCRTFLDYTGFDPFMFLSFYVGHAYGPLAGLIFGFLFGCSYALAQINMSMRVFWFIPICTLIGLASGFLAPVPIMIAGFSLIIIGAILDIACALTFVGPIPQLFIWHTGHTIFVVFLMTVVLKHLPGI